MADNETSIEESIMESAWNACKRTLQAHPRTDRTQLENYVSTIIALEFGQNVAALYREEWMGEINIFCAKYSIH